MDEIITKRLHISGLTPALTADDLSRRLSTFGTVKSVDGFGLPDGLGQPRKFGYVTLETTQGKLARCLNLLSGSTWKGAKLRIGEAKPDFAERIAAEHEAVAAAAATEPPKKKRKRGAAGREAEDMSLVTPENVAGRGGWKVTPLGRIVKSIRMRPEHPLPPQNEDKEKARLKGKTKKGEEVKKKRKRATDPDTRARRRTIDVTRYGSVHLKGMFLEMEVLGTKRDEEAVRVPAVEVESESSESEEDEQEEVIVEVVEEVAQVAEQSPETEHASKPIKDLPPPPAPAPALSSLPDDNTDIQTEKKLSLNLLASLFGGKQDADWVGRESVGSDVDETEISKRHRMVVDEAEDGDFEVVPMDADVAGGGAFGSDNEEEADEENVVADEAMEVEAEAPAPPPPTQKQQQVTKLKDLFAPREDEAGFSLLGHLDLDLELDDEIPFATTETITPIPHPSLPSTTTTTFSATPLPYVAPQLDAKAPLFFPYPASAGPSTKARPKDIFEVAMENKWHWRDTTVEFYRTGTEEDIRKRWEEGKGELTREWKRRCREAGKVSRRSGGGDTGDA
ncbi:hypothetical protein C0991_007676 [Blastosporella zonata]|nr:hypothetical protein C0991_007676 [Blastosporella zonata]